MGVDISWQVFDAEEVERMWNHYSLGELISLVKEDKLFWERRKSCVPEETLTERRKRAWQAQLLLPNLEKFSEVAKVDKTLEWNVRIGLANHVSQTDLLELDREFISYFAYLEAGNRYGVFSEATQAMYETQGLEFNENNLIFESITSRWLSIMRKTDVGTVTAWLANQAKKDPSRRFLPTTEMDEIKEDAEYTRKDVREVVALLDFANKHGLPVYAEVGMIGYDYDCGTGEHNLVARFHRRFANVRFPEYWIEYLPGTRGLSGADMLPKEKKGGIFEGCPFDPHAPHYRFYIMDGDKYHNVRRLVRTKLLKKAMNGLFGLRFDGTSYSWPAYHISIDLPLFRKGCGATIDFPLLFGDPTIAYDQAMCVGKKVTELTGLKLYDPQARDYVDSRGLAPAKKFFLEYLNRVSTEGKMPPSHVPRWRGKKWPMIM